MWAFTTSVNLISDTLIPTHDDFLLKLTFDQNGGTSNFGVYGATWPVLCLALQANGTARYEPGTFIVKSGWNKLKPR